jgi:hypothetical protein
MLILGTSQRDIAVRERHAPHPIDVVVSLCTPTQAIFAADRRLGQDQRRSKVQTGQEQPTGRPEVDGRLALTLLHPHCCTHGATITLLHPHCCTHTTAATLLQRAAVTSFIWEM